MSLQYRLLISLPAVKVSSATKLLNHRARHAAESKPRNPRLLITKPFRTALAAPKPIKLS